MRIAALVASGFFATFTTLVSAESPQVAPLSLSASQLDSVTAGSPWAVVLATATANGDYARSVTDTGASVSANRLSWNGGYDYTVVNNGIASATAVDSEDEASRSAAVATTDESGPYVLRGSIAREISGIHTDLAVASNYERGGSGTEFFLSRAYPLMFLVLGAR